MLKNRTRVRILMLGGFLLLMSLALYGCSLAPFGLKDISEVKREGEQTSASSAFKKVTPQSVWDTLRFAANRNQPLQQALQDPMVQELLSRLEARGHRPKLKDAFALEFEQGGQGGIYVVIPFVPKAYLSFVSCGGKITAKAIVKRGKRMAWLAPQHQESVIRELDEEEKRGIFRLLRQKPKYREFEQRLEAAGRVVDERKSVAKIEELQKKLFVWIATALKPKRAQELSPSLLFYDQTHDYYYTTADLTNYTYLDAYFYNDSYPTVYAISDLLYPEPYHGTPVFTNGGGTSGCVLIDYREFRGCVFASFHCVAFIVECILCGPGRPNVCKCISAITGKAIPCP